MTRESEIVIITAYWVCICQVLLNHVIISLSFYKSLICKCMRLCKMCIRTVISIINATESSSLVTKIAAWFSQLLHD